MASLAQLIPAELLVSIVNRDCPGSDCASYRLVCRHWNTVLDSEYYWREAFQKWYCGDGDWCALKEGSTWKSVCRTAITQINYLSTPEQQFAWAVGAAPRYWSVAARTVASVLNRPHSSIIESAFLAACSDGHLTMMVQLLQSPHVFVDMEIQNHTPLYIACRAGQLDVVRFLLEGGARPDPVSSNSLPLVVAAREGHKDVVDVLIEHRADVNLYTPKHGTAMHVASERGRTAIVASLLEAGADVDPMLKDAQTPLLLAAKTGDAELVQLLLHAGASVNVATVEGETPLMSACHALEDASGIEHLKLLLEAGANVNARKSSTGSTALVIAAQKQRFDVVEMLLKAGADVSLARKSFTPLHVAAARGNPDIVRLLLDHGSRVDEMTDNECTPLYLASTSGHIKVVELLISRGASVSSDSFRRGSALLVASRFGHVDVVKCLIANGSGVNECDPKRSTPLLNALRHAHWDVANILLEAGADATKCCPNTGRSPVLIAAHFGRRDVVELLLQKGGSRRINTADPSEGRTPLIASIEANNVELVDLILKHGADANREAGDGRTPLHFAMEHGSDAVVALLLESKANPLAEDGHGKAVLDYACRFQNEAAVHRLLRHPCATQYGSNALLEAAATGNSSILVRLLSDLRYLSGQTSTRTTAISLSLWVAARSGFSHTAHVLVEHHANVNMVHREMSPLFVACRFGHLDVVRILLTAGADPNLPRGNGDTPLFIAAREGHDEIVQVLLAIGAEA